jgi:hypothetical protein
VQLFVLHLLMHTRHIITFGNLSISIVAISFRVSSPFSPIYHLLLTALVILNQSLPVCCLAWTVARQHCRRCVAALTSASVLIDKIVSTNAQSGFTDGANLVTELFGLLLR